VLLRIAGVYNLIESGGMSIANVRVAQAECELQEFVDFPFKNVIGFNSRNLN